MKSFKFKRVLTTFSAVFCLAVSPYVSAQTSSALSTKEVMRSAFQSLSYLIEVAMDAEFDHSDDPEFTSALDQLASISGQIGEHTGSKVYSMDLVARSLETNVNQLVSNYKAGFDGIGEVYLVETIDHCAACHSQSPEIAATLDVDQFVQKVREEKLDSSLAARMMVAVRKFPEALQIWERRLLNKDFSLKSDGAEEAVLEYIYQAIQLEAGAQSVANVLNSLVQGEEVPYYFKRKLETWGKQIALIEKVNMDSISLDTIESTNEACRRLESDSLRREFPVCNILVSNLSSNMLRHGSNLSPETDASLYVNLGVTRMNMGLPSSYVPQVERFFEAAILAAPGSDASKTAFSHLEELSYYFYGDLELADEVMDISIEGLRSLAEIN